MVQWDSVYFGASRKYACIECLQFKDLKGESIGWDHSACTKELGKKYFLTRNRRRHSVAKS